MKKKKNQSITSYSTIRLWRSETGCYDIAHFLHEQNCKSYIATSGGELLKFINKKR